MKKKTGLLGILVGLILLVGCSTVYYSVWEKLGKEKRDLLLSKLSNTREAQGELKESLESTAQRIQKEYPFDAGQTGKAYDMLSDDYNSVKRRYEAVQHQSSQANTIARDLFREWEKEANGMEDASLRRQSLQHLRSSKGRFQRLSEQMQRSIDRVTPLLKKLDDHRLFRKHLLNAKATRSLEKSLKGLEPEIESLKKDVEKSIQSVTEFESTLKSDGPMT